MQKTDKKTSNESELNIAGIPASEQGLALYKHSIHVELIQYIFFHLLVHLLYYLPLQSWSWFKYQQYAIAFFKALRAHQYPVISKTIW